MTGIGEVDARPTICGKPICPLKPAWAGNPVQGKEMSMSNNPYSRYYDPTGRTQFTKDLWAKTNERIAGHGKMMDEIAAAKRRFDPDPPVPGTHHRSGSGGSFFWLAIALAAGGWMLLHLS
jgi:hypothetical protein